MSTITLDGDVATIHMLHDHTAIINASDVEKVAAYNWIAAVRAGHRTTAQSYEATSGGQRTIHLASVLFPTRKRGHIRHLNGDTLDFRRSNVEIPGDDCRIDGNIAYIRLSNGEDAILDSDDLDKVLALQARWYRNKGGYVATRKLQDGKHTSIYLHRLVMDAPDGMTVDHRFHNKLDNRKSQLQLVTQKVNNENREGADRDSVTGIRGVFPCNIRTTRYYVARVGQRRNVKSRYFPQTPEGLAHAAEAVKEMRAVYLTNSH